MSEMVHFLLMSWETVIAEKKLGMLEDEKRTGKWTIAKIKVLTLTISADTVM